MDKLVGNGEKNAEVFASFLNFISFNAEYRTFAACHVGLLTVTSILSHEIVFMIPPFFALNIVLFCFLRENI